MFPKFFMSLGCLMLAWTAGAAPGCARSIACAAQGGAPARAEPQADWAFGGPLPGAAPFDAALVKRLDAAWANRSPSYQARTRHLRADGTPRYTNRLFLESSPYLRQHAHNPVSWYPWGDEAFAAARALGRPVLLSIGYSTCHWCHVMEEESFEDEAIARYLNEHYVAIKVDREQRPDLDALYTRAVQMLSGSGGWPTNVWLTPEREPFFGGTYFPPRDGERGATVGFLTLLKRLKQAYDAGPERVAAWAARVSGAVAKDLVSAGAAQGLPDAGVLVRAARDYAQRFDPRNGGLQGAPKFPSALPVRFLLRYHRRTGDAQALAMATVTLERMAAGGIHDHVGGGFHRYATDERWLVPHFEKMLYDNALLTLAYLEGYQATGREAFARVARDILDYVARDMTSPRGAFFSATDADSLAPDGQREEGRFYTWSEDEVEKVLGAARAPSVMTYYGITMAGNFAGRNILHTRRPLAEVAETLKLPSERLRTLVEESKELLRAARSRRPPPLRDGKILAAWNGLMISAYARGALILGEQGYARRASRAADFVLVRMRAEGRLSRSFLDGTRSPDAYLEDYAFLVAGLLDLYEATGQPRWLSEAIALDHVLETHYEDQEARGYFRTADDAEVLLAREKPGYDGAEPSGNSVQALNLLRLHDFTEIDSYRRRAQQTLRAFTAPLTQAPSELSEMLLAVDYWLDTPKEVVIVTPAGGAGAAALLAPLRRAFLPNRVLVVVAQGQALAALASTVPMVRGKVARGGKATAYVCEHGACGLPTTRPEVFARQIASRASIAGQKSGAAAGESLPLQQGTAGPP